MTRYALLIRGVNVGGRRSLPMARLRSLLENIGCANVQTFLQSGNAVFSTAMPRDRLVGTIERALAGVLGDTVPVTVRTLAQMRAIRDGNPYPDAVSNPSFLCVTFLCRTPEPGELARLHQRDFGLERFHVSGSEIYSWHPNGQGRSPLAQAIGALPLGGAVTTRNWNTVAGLTALLVDG